MITLFESKEHCCGCTACMNICPRNAIGMKEDSEGFLYPHIDNDLCIQCEACRNVCAFHKKEYADKIPKNQDVYAMKHSDEIRKCSTSGGAFMAITDYVLSKNGAIYGAIFDDTFKVIHSKAFMEDDRNNMRGSKYVQSELGDIFKDVKDTLKKGILVLFTGTPCQNEGLKSYLGKDYDNLVLCDIACHGVPSPKIWDNYKKYLEEKYKDKISNVNFRSKKTGWKKSSLQIDFREKVHLKSMQEDPYYILFFSHLSIRPSCHECVYASYHRIADITMADFWGVEDANKLIDDDLGISLLLVNTKKGKEIIDSIKGNIYLEKSNHNYCYQPIFESPSTISPKRDIFWRDYLDNDFDLIIKKYGRLSFIQLLIKKLIVPILKKVKLHNIVAKLYFRHLNM